MKKQETIQILSNFKLSLFFKNKYKNCLKLIISTIIRKQTGITDPIIPTSENNCRYR